MKMDCNEEVNMQQLTVKFQSKKELYDIIGIDCNVFLPLKHDVNSEYVSGIMTEDIVVSYDYHFLLIFRIYTNEFKVIHVPIIKAWIQRIS